MRARAGTPGGCTSLPCAHARRVAVARTWQRAARRQLVLARACEPLRHAWRGAASTITMARPVCQGCGAAHSAAQRRG